MDDVSQEAVAWTERDVARTQWVSNRGSYFAAAAALLAMPPPQQAVASIGVSFWVALCVSGAGTKICLCIR